jgi:hypothetical protein
LDGKQICSVKGQPRDGSQATKFWTTNGRPEVRPLVVHWDLWCIYSMAACAGTGPFLFFTKLRDQDQGLL